MLQGPRVSIQYRRPVLSIYVSIQQRSRHLHISSTHIANLRHGSTHITNLRHSSTHITNLRHSSTHITNLRHSSTHLVSSSASSSSAATSTRSSSTSPEDVATGVYMTKLITQTTLPNRASGIRFIHIITDADTLSPFSSCPHQFRIWDVNSFTWIY